MDLHDDSGKIANLEVFVWHSYFLRFLCFFFYIFGRLGVQNQRMRGYAFQFVLQQVLPVQVCEGSGPWEMLQCTYLCSAGACKHDSY